LVPEAPCPVRRHLVGLADDFPTEGIHPGRQYRPHHTAQLIASLILFALPAATSAFNGVRAEHDLVRLAERSGGAAIALARLRRVIDAAAPSYDRIAVAAMRAASIMAAELSDWRFVLERRRARSRPPTLGRRKR
jgi:hypothetical protein